MLLKVHRFFTILSTISLSLFMVSCNQNLMAAYTVEEMETIISAWSESPITFESELPVFEQTTVTYFINNVPVETLNGYERPLYDQFQSLKVTLYGSDKTKTSYYDIYVLSTYSPKHNYEIRIDGASLDQMDRETFQEVSWSVKQEVTTLIDDMPVRMRGRGNSSWFNHEKKSFRIEFDQNIDMMGLPSHDTYYLVSMHSDKSLMRDVLAHQLANLLELEITHETRYVDLYINENYHGLYLLIEDRTFNDPDPFNDAVMFALELDFRVIWDGVNDIPWFDHAGIPYVVKRPLLPSNEDINDIHSFLDSVSNLLNLGHIDETVIDIGNWIDYFFIQEYFKNVDSWSLSTFIYKNHNEPMRFGPVWDFDLSIGNADYVNDNYINPTGYYFINHPFGKWQVEALAIPEVEQLFHTRIQSFYVDDFPVWHTMIDTLASSLELYAERNFSRWPILNTYIWPNPEILITETYDEQTRFVSNFLKDRMQWLLEETL